MSAFTYKSIGVIIDHLKGWSRNNIDHFLEKHGVAPDLFADRPESYSKLRLLRDVFRDLMQNENTSILKGIAEAVLIDMDSSQREFLEKALQADGLIIEEGKLLAGPVTTAEERTALEIMIQRNSCLSQETLLHHLKDSHDLYTLEKWDASIGQARNFIEQLLHDIAEYAAGQRTDDPDLSKPVKVREYLESVGFFENVERKKLIDGVYGYFSDEGSHPGISDQRVAWVCRIICLVIGQYLIEKLENP
jgi:hypothetical protein